MMTGMKRIFLTISAALLSLSSGAHAYETFKDRKPVVHEGLVTLYQAEDEIYMEIPSSLMGRRMLMGTVVEASSDPLESAVGYQPLVPYVVCFEKTPVSVHLCRPNESYVCRDGRKMSDSNISSIEKTFKIKEYNADSTAFLVDATSFFVCHDESVNPLDPKAYNASGGFVKRTGSFVSSTSMLKDVFSSDESFSVSISNSYKVKSAFLGIFASSQQTVVTSQVRRTFVLLPQDRMRPLSYDPSVGTHFVSLEDFDEEKPASANRRYATRWRMETDEDGEVRNPVRFYVDDSFPASWVPYIHESVEQWNGAFRQIGIKSALEVMDYPDNDSGFDPSDIRYNCIRYSLSPSETITDSRWCDPLTGEILGAGVVVSHGVAENIKKNILLQTSAGCPASRSFVVDSVLFGKALKSMLMRNIGHCLGLSDNMAGSWAYPVDSLKSARFTAHHGISSSVMDELPFNFIAYSSAEADKDVMMFQEKPGEYDLYALSFLYEGKYPSRSHLFGSRQKLTDFYDPRSMSFDLGSDAVSSVEHGFKGLAEAVAGMNGWLDKDDVDYNLRGGVQEAVLLQAYEYIKQVFVSVGGIYVNPKNASDSHDTYVSVPKDVQKRHLLWALERIDDLSFLDDEKLLADSAVRGDTGEFCQKYFTNFIFIQIDAMWLSEIKSSDPYTQEEALADVAGHIWRGALKGDVPTDLQKYQQTSYVDNLLSWAGVRGNYYFREKNTSREASRPDKSHIWYGFLKDTKKLLEKAARKASSPEGKSHYSYLLYKMEKHL